MADHTENTLRAAIKALTDVVAPSIRADDALAQEQLRLVTDYLRFMAQRIDLLADRQAYECAQYLALARRVAPFCAAASPQVREGLASAIAAAEALPAGARLTERRTATTALAGAIRRLVREAARFDPDARGSIERAVLDGSTALINFERAWYLPMGFDPAPREVGTVEAALAAATP